jgi:hypothetical protein
MKKSLAPTNSTRAGGSQLSARCIMKPAPIARSLRLFAPTEIKVWSRSESVGGRARQAQGSTQFLGRPLKAATATRDSIPAAFVLYLALGTLQER